MFKLMTNVKLAPEKQAFFWKWIKISIIVFIATGFCVLFLSKYYSIGFDPQRQLCLPWRAFLIEKNKKPDLNKGNLVRFRSLNMNHEGFPDGIFVIKYIAATKGDHIKIKDGFLYINNFFYGKLWLYKTLGKTHDFFDREETVPEKHLFVLGTHPGSYDSRYWGFVKEEQVEGVVHVVF